MSEGMIETNQDASHEEEGIAIQNSPVDSSCQYIPASRLVNQWLQGKLAMEFCKWDSLEERLRDLHYVLSS